jgi:hypothetical protein
MAYAIVLKTKKSYSKMFIEKDVAIIHMHLRQQLSISLIIGIAILAATTTVSYTSSFAQDLNPPTTGRTSENLTSTFGTNTTVSNRNITGGDENKTS